MSCPGVSSAIGCDPAQRLRHELLVDFEDTRLAA